MVGYLGITLSLHWVFVVIGLLVMTAAILILYQMRVCKREFI
jgi:hypothetical protein